MDTNLGILRPYCGGRSSHTIPDRRLYQANSHADRLEEDPGARVDQESLLGVRCPRDEMFLEAILCHESHRRGQNHPI
jgi:hypothetical protein